VGRTGRAIAVSCATLGVLVATAAWAAEPKAAIQGELDRGLRQDIARAIGEVKNRAQSPLDARRRAREQPLVGPLADPRDPRRALSAHGHEHMAADEQSEPQDHDRQAHDALLRRRKSDLG